MEPSLRQKIFKILPFNISKEDKLPKDCCYKCIDSLKQFISFVDKSWYIQKTFLRKVCLEESEPNKATEIPLPDKWYENDSQGEQKNVEATNKEKDQKHVGKEPTKPKVTKTGEDKEKDAKPKDTSLENETNKEVKEKYNEVQKDKEINTEITQEPTDIGEESTSANRIEKRPLSSKGLEDSDGTIRSSSFSPQMDEKERKKKKKLRFKRRNPFLLPKRKSIPKKKRNKEAEVLIADKEEHFGMEGLGFCRLIVNGEITFVEKPAAFKNDHLIMSCVPNFGIIYCCQKCDVIYTTENAAMRHDCEDKGQVQPSSTKPDDSLSKQQYTCQICDLGFPRRVALEHHISTHMFSDASDDSLPRPKPRARKRRRESSDSSVNIKLRRSRDTSESESSIASDNFVVDDDTIIYEKRTKRKRRARSRNRTRLQKTTQSIVESSSDDNS
ncbi:hypothetical protein M8J76_008194 [Diaphorina citri]|nr:hypothetical protein M8J75_000213 [Diaphorina citri]KAI5749546.1 hypothetical protein M8J76_008194 [Diaphorina citri]